MKQKPKDDEARIEKIERQQQDIRDIDDAERRMSDAELMIEVEMEMEEEERR